jgi:hypothetical protein
MMLAEATFTSETDSGWQQVLFATPVLIQAHTIYIASYYAPQGYYAVDLGSPPPDGYQTSPGNLLNGADNAPLHAVANNSSPNGVFLRGGPGCPSQSGGSGNNYWVDVVMVPAPPPNQVTDGSGCVFDRDPTTPDVQDFHLIFIQDPQNWPCYKLAASNPGQFFYNVFYVGTPGDSVTFNVTLPYPFVTQGANPIHAYDSVTVEGGSGQPCRTLGNAFFVSSQQVGLADYGTVPAASLAIPAVNLRVPPSGVVYLTIHLDYGLKGGTGYLTDASADAVDCATGTKRLIPNKGTYTFSVDGALTATASIQNINSFKKIPGVAGLVYDSNGNPVQGAGVILKSATLQPLITAFTDEDGFYMLAYKQTGKVATFNVSVGLPPDYSPLVTQPIQLRANSFVRQDFNLPSFE